MCSPTFPRFPCSSIGATWLVLTNEMWRSQLTLDVRRACEINLDLSTEFGALSVTTTELSCLKFWKSCIVTEDGNVWCEYRGKIEDLRVGEVSDRLRGSSSKSFAAYKSQKMSILFLLWEQTYCSWRQDRDPTASLADSPRLTTDWPQTARIFLQPKVCSLVYYLLCHVQRGLPRKQIMLFLPLKNRCKQWVNKLWYIKTKDYVALKRTERSNHEKTWRNLTCIVLSERSSSEKVPYPRIPSAGKGKTMEIIKRSGHSGGVWLGRDGQWKYSVWYHDGNVPLYICPNP